MNIFSRKLVEEIPEYGLKVFDEEWEVDGNIILMKNAVYNDNNDYVGIKEIICFLWEKYGIRPEKSNVNHSICSIGYSKLENKWFGWSHRTIYGFGVGDEVKEGDCCASSGWTDEYLKDHPEEDLSLPVGFISKTMEDAKRMAIAYAESVN